MKDFLIEEPADFQKSAKNQRVRNLELKQFYRRKRAQKAHDQLIAQERFEKRMKRNIWQ